MTTIDETPIPCPDCGHPHGGHRPNFCLICSHLATEHKRRVNESGTALICAGSALCDCTEDPAEGFHCPADGCECTRAPEPYCPVERAPLAECTCFELADPTPCPKSCGHLLTEHGTHGPTEDIDHEYLGCLAPGIDCRCELPADTVIPKKARR